MDWFDCDRAPDCTHFAPATAGTDCPQCPLESDGSYSCYYGRAFHCSCERCEHLSLGAGSYASAIEGN